MPRRRQYSSQAIRSVQFSMFAAVHRAVRTYLKRTVGTLKGTSNITSAVLFNLYEREVALNIRSNIAAAVTHLHRALRRKVSVPYPPASLPGEAPHLRTGVGRASISRGLIRGVNSNFEQLIFLKPEGYYMALLEAGFWCNAYGSGHFVWIDPRPWLESTMNEEFSQIERILRKGFD